MSALLRYSLLAALFFAATLTSPSETPGSGAPLKDLPTLPPGTTLPVSLSRTLHAGKIRVGAGVLARTTQRVPMPGRTYLPAGTELTGQVAATTTHALTVRFDSVTFRGQTAPIATHPIAIATFVAVSETGVPAIGATDRGNPNPANWTTAQVGGDQIMRSGWIGPLVNGSTQTVGSADYWGVYALPATPDAPPRALGPFSANASGLFGFALDCTLARTKVALACARSHPTLHHGDVILLQVE